MTNRRMDVLFGQDKGILGGVMTREGTMHI